MLSTLLYGSAANVALLFGFAALGFLAGYGVRAWLFPKS